MKVAIIGYGNMGKEIEKVLVSRGHEISKVIDIENNNQDYRDIEIAIIFSTPSFGKPKLLSNDSSLISLWTLGLWLPYCALGVMVPTSINPKPISSNCFTCVAFLSKPAANPRRFFTFRPFILKLVCLDL